MIGIAARSSALHRAVAASVLVTTPYLLHAAPAAAHVDVVSGPAFANSTQIVKFGVGHGCEGSDTFRVRIEIPQEIASVRALNGDLGPATVEVDDAGIVTAVTWEKPVEEVVDGDVNYYELALRVRMPDAPFTTLYFPTYQECRTSDGDTLSIDWIGTGEEEGVEPAPAVKIVPRHFPGWNKFTVSAPIDDLSAFFSDALIVWRENEAYSANPFTAELIDGTPDVVALERLEAGDEIWVKY